MTIPKAGLSFFLRSGCGVKKVSMVNMKASQYIPIHSKQIRGLSFNRRNDSLLLSAALDNTIKLTRYEHELVITAFCHDDIYF